MGMNTVRRLLSIFVSVNFTATSNERNLHCFMLMNFVGLMARPEGNQRLDICVFLFCICDLVLNPNHDDGAVSPR